MALRVTRRHVDGVTAAHGEVQEARRGVGAHTQHPRPARRKPHTRLPGRLCSHVVIERGRESRMAGWTRARPVQLHAGTEARLPVPAGFRNDVSRTATVAAWQGVGGGAGIHGGRRPATSPGIGSPAAANGEPSSVARKRTISPGPLRRTALRPS